MTARTQIRPLDQPPPSAGGDTLDAGSCSGEAEPPDPGRSLFVDVVTGDDDWSAFGDAPAAVIAAAAALSLTPVLALRRCQAVIALSGDEEVARLNGTYRNSPKPTNVLSFQAPPSRRRAHVRPDARRPLGDIILARETLLREAAEMGIPPRHHLQHLVVHGLLHLLGYDHATRTQAAVMESLEVEILARIGIPNPYDEAAQGAAQPGLQ